MPRCELDHLVVTAPTLEAGAAYVQDLLGVTLEAGGEHAKMGTHNLLLRLGDATYLEVIAPNPAAPRPKRARWFELDALRADSPPCLATWAARTNDIEGVASAATEMLGGIETMSRGELEWRVTIPEEGRLTLGGVAPFLIEWKGPTHPASRLRDAGCSLVALRAMHPEPKRVDALFRSIGLAGDLPVERGSPGLIAEIRTPDGIRRPSGIYMVRLIQGSKSLTSRVVILR